MIEASAQPPVAAEVSGYDWLSPTIVRLGLTPLSSFAFMPGQCIALSRHGVTRTYCIASSPAQRGLLELHLRIVRGGEMSHIVVMGTQIGDRFEVAGPFGGLTYADVDPQAPLVLVGAGTGLSSLWGVLQTALGRGHQGPIILVHGAGARSGLYLHEALTALQQRHPNLTYEPSLQCNTATSGDLQGVLNRLDLPLGSAHLFLSGHPGMVAGLRRAAQRNGASPERIHSLAYLAAHHLEEAGGVGEPASA